MMAPRRILLVSLTMMLLVAQNATAAQRKIASRRTVSTSSSGERTDPELRAALALAKSGNYRAATQKLYELAVNPRFEQNRLQIKYLLGLTLYELKLYQTAAFQFVDVVRSGESRFLRPSLEKLSLAADKLDNDTLLNYAISRVKVDEFPATDRDMLYYRVGEYKLKSKNYEEAAQSFGHVHSNSSFYPKAKYMQALAYAENKEPDKGLEVIDQLLALYASKPVTDTNRVAAMMAKARTLYQRKDWDGAIEAYRQIPRDTLYWHDALFESSWAMLRAARFRSVVSNFHSLHSTYYEDFYIPESMLLRGIVYLYICKYDEMNKTLDSFEQIYGPLHHAMVGFLKSTVDPMIYFNEADKVMSNLDEMKADKSKRTGLTLPFIITRHVIGHGDFERNYAYVKLLQNEKDTIDKLGSTWKNSPVGRYAQKIVATRTLNAEKTVGRIVRNHLIAMQNDLRDLVEQSGLLRYEMLNGRKTEIRKKIAGKTLEEKQIDGSSSRSYYVQNGYEYWPFRGEYWLDEIGNYHYLGVQNCE